MIIVATSAAAAFQITVRLRMAIACPADGFGVVGLPWLGAKKRRGSNLNREETRMAIDPNAIGATTEPMLFEWTDRDTLLYALGVGAGTEDLSFTTENSHDIPQQVLPTYAVICCPAFGAAGKIGIVQLGHAAARFAGHPAARAAAAGGKAVGGHRGRRHPGQGRGQERDHHAARPRHRPGHRRR